MTISGDGGREGVRGGGSIQMTGRHDTRYESQKAIE